MFRYDIDNYSVCGLWHHFQGQNAVIDTKYRQNFRACGGRTSPQTLSPDRSLHTSLRPLT